MPQIHGEANSLRSRIHASATHTYTEGDLFRYPGTDHWVARLYDRRVPAVVTFDSRLTWLLQRVALLPSTPAPDPAVAEEIAVVLAELDAAVAQAEAMAMRLLQLSPRE
jgi:hypothetical protein